MSSQIVTDCRSVYEVTAKRPPIGAVATAQGLTLRILLLILSARCPRLAVQRDGDIKESRPVMERAW